MTQNFWTITRIHGFLGEPTSLGCLVGLAIILQLNTSHKTKFVYSFRLGALAILLLLSGSRTGIVSIIFAVSVAWVILKYFRPSIKTQHFIVFSILAIAILSFILLVIQKYGPQIEYYALRGMNNEQSRLYAWSKALEWIGMQPPLNLILGSGSGALSSVFQSAFNNYLQVFYDYGLLGLLIFCAFLFYLILETCKNRVSLQILLYFICFNIFLSWFPTDGFNALTIALAYILSRASKTLNLNNKI